VPRTRFARLFSHNLIQERRGYEDSAGAHSVRSAPARQTRSAPPGHEAANRECRARQRRCRHADAAAYAEARCQTDRCANLMRRITLRQAGGTQTRAIYEPAGAQDARPIAAPAMQRNASARCLYMADADANQGGANRCVVNQQRCAEPVRRAARCATHDSMPARKDVYTQVRARATPREESSRRRAERACGAAAYAAAAAQHAEPNHAARAERVFAACERCLRANRCSRREVRGARSRALMFTLYASAETMLACYFENQRANPLFERECGAARASAACDRQAGRRCVRCAQARCLSQRLAVRAHSFTAAAASLARRAECKVWRCRYRRPPYAQRLFDVSASPPQRFDTQWRRSSRGGKQRRR